MRRMSMFTKHGQINLQSYLCCQSGVIFFVKTRIQTGHQLCINSLN